MSDRIIFWGVVFCGLLPFFVDTPKACVERGGWDHAEGVVQRTAMRPGPVAWLWLWLGCGLAVVVAVVPLYCSFAAIFIGPSVLQLCCNPHLDCKSPLPSR